MTNPQVTVAPFDESFLDGEHAAFLEQLYHQYQQNPHSVPTPWQQYFERLEATPVYPRALTSGGDDTVMGQRTLQMHVSRLINAYRY